MADYVPDSSKILVSVLKVLREGRRSGARYFYITGDLNVLGVMCTDETDIEDLNEIGPLCWQGYDHEPRSFKKMMYGIMFNCKATSTWSKCRRAKETVFTHRQLGDRRQGWKSQVDCVTVPTRKDHDAYV